MTSDFLPMNYSVPSTGGGAYTKLQQGQNQIRFLSAPILGHLWFEYTDETGGVKLPEDRNPQKRPVKPVRVRMSESIPSEAAEAYKHFWAMSVWNYQTNQVEILEITQRSIQEGIEILFQNQNWGDPRNFDIVINKTGTGLETKYSVSPIPPAPLSESIKEVTKATSINLEALYDGDNPFEVKELSEEPQEPQEPQETKKTEEVNIDDIPF